MCRCLVERQTVKLTKVEKMANIWIPKSATFSSLPDKPSLPFHAYFVPIPSSSPSIVARKNPRTVFLKNPIPLFLPPPLSLFLCGDLSVLSSQPNQFQVSGSYVLSVIMKLGLRGLVDRMIWVINSVSMSFIFFSGFSFDEQRCSKKTLFFMLQIVISGYE